MRTIKPLLIKNKRNMKYKLLIIILLLCSCFSDKGNYDYAEIKDVVIEGVTDQIMYDKISFMDTLEINPVLTFRNGANIADYEYEWKLVPMRANSKPEGEDYIISTEKNLKYSLVESTGIYNGYFRVKNKVTGNTFSKTFFVSVRTLLSNGLAILCEKDEKAHLNWIFHKDETEEIILKDIWKTAPDDVELMGKPISLAFYDYGSNNPMSRFRMVNCEKGSFCLDTIQMTGEQCNLKYRFGDSRENIHIRGGNGVIRSSKPRIMTLIDKKGDVYLKTDLSTAIFAYPSNIVFNERDKFVAAPFVAASEMVGGSQKGQEVIFYDQTNCRFVGIKDSWNAIASFTVTKFIGSMFESTENREMVFMETTSSLFSYAILKDKTTGKHYIYGFKIGNQATNTQRYYRELKGPDLDKATSFLFHNIHDCLLYSAGNKVYRFDLADKNSTSEEVLSLPGEEIVKLKTYKRTIYGVEVLDYMLAYQNRILVASNTSTNTGNIRVYNMPSAKGDLTLHRDFSNHGFEKIVDIHYFE